MFPCQRKKVTSKKYFETLLVFLYSSMIKFCRTDKIRGIPLLRNFIENLKEIMNKTYLHHLHITGEIIGYAHSFCSTKVRENKYKITVASHNLFRCDFFFLLKGLRAGVWRTRDLSIGSKKPYRYKFCKHRQSNPFP